MGAAAAALIRIIIQAAVQTGILIAAEKLLSPLVDAAKRGYANAFNLTDSEAEDTLANDIIDALALVGVIGISIKTKLPTKVAEKLGFTSKGYSKRKLRPETEAKLKTKSKPNTSSGVATADDIAEIAKVTASSRGYSVSTVQSLFNNILKITGLTTAMFFAFAQYIDFANWQGPYQKTFQRILEVITFGRLSVDSPIPKARVISSDIWNRIAATVEELGPIGISFPDSGIDKPYSRQNLADLVDEVAANLARNKIQTSYKNVLAVVLPLVQLSGGTPFSTASAQKPAASSATPSVKVFTGVVSNGVLGSALAFTSRPDDLIENMGELQSAIDNNLAPFLTTLPGRIIYEIKVVSSIITAEGLKKGGEAQTIQTGVDSSGRPKTRTIINKWAVLDLYILTDKGTRSKIKSIVLGPTDAAKFRPDTSTLAAVSQVIPQSAITLNTSDILSVVPNDPKPVTAENFARAIGVPEERIDQKTGEIIQPTAAEIAAYNYQFSNTPPASPVVNKSASNAGTLFEWYAAQGQKLPPISQRAQLYQSLGLGQASLYVGTAEQNMKLLSKLKEPPPAPPAVAIAQSAPPFVQNTQAPAPSGFFRPGKGVPVYDRSSGASLGLADGNTDYNSSMVRV